MFAWQASVEPGNSSVRLSKEVRAMPDFKRHDTINCWYNYRLPEIAAAVALGEFERMDDLCAMVRTHPFRSTRIHCNLTAGRYLT